MPYKANEARRHKIPRARYRVTNWPEYDRALQQRGSLTLWVTPEALAAWHPPRTGRRGRSPQYAAIAIETGHLLRLAFGRPWRQTEGLLRSLATLLGVGIGIPDHTTFSRRSPGLALAKSLAQARRSGPVHVVVDATGLKVHGAGEWLVETHGERGKRSWRKLHLAVDPESGEILASELTTPEAGDAALVGPLLERITGPIASVTADGAYDGEPVYRAVAERQPDPPAAVIIPPRATAVPGPTADTTPSQRDRHLRMIQDKGRMGWQKAMGYGRRSLGETAVFRYSLGETAVFRAMEEVRAFVGLDVHKETISVAVADAGRLGEVRHVGTIQNSPTAIGKLARGLARRHGAVEFVYEAGSCGYNVQRQLAAMGLTCRICAPSLTPRKPGERIKNDRRDAIALARLHRAGELTYVWVPDALHEALRDLVRARHAACQDVRRDRIRIQAFLLRCDLRFEGKPWSHRHRMWLCSRQFAHPAQQVAFQTYLNALGHDEARKAEVEGQIRELLGASPWARQMQALKGVGPVVAATIIAEVGDFSRFAHPRQLVAYFGLAPGEHSSGGTVRPRGITKAGSAIARAVLCEAAWNYRTTPKVGQWMKERCPPVPQDVAALAWKAQLRLHKTYRRLTARGKRSVVATAAVARELLGFAWSIGRRVPLGA